MGFKEMWGSMISAMTCAGTRDAKTKSVSAEELVPEPVKKGCLPCK